MHESNESSTMPSKSLILSGQEFTARCYPNRVLSVGIGIRDEPTRVCASLHGMGRSSSRNLMDQIRTAVRKRMLASVVEGHRSIYIPLRFNLPSLWLL